MNHFDPYESLYFCFSVLVMDAEVINKYQKKQSLSLNLYL